MLKMFVSDVVVVPLGAGVAGLSAIATAHSLGCKVHDFDFWFRWEDVEDIIWRKT